MKWFVLVSLLVSQSALAAQEWQLKVYDEAAQAGDRIAYRWAWTNTTEKPVRVPADLFDRFVVTADYKYRMINARAGNGVATEVMTKADSVKWVTVMPGESHQKIGELADYFPACKGGCATGNYTLTVKGVTRHWDALASDQLEPAPPEMTWQRSLASASDNQLVPVSAGPGLAMSIIKVGNVDAKGNVKVKVTVTNRLNAAVWFPTTAILTDWDLRTEQGTSHGAEVADGMVSWGPDEGGVLVRPGKSYSWVVETSIDLEAGKSWVTAKIRNGCPFAASTQGLASRFYFDGRLTSPELRVR